MALGKGVLGKFILGLRRHILGGDAAAESGTGTGIGSGTGADAVGSSGNATAEGGTGTSTGSGTGADASATINVDIKFELLGDSNGDGRATNNQPAPADGAFMLNSAGQIVALADPSAGGTHTYPILDDGASSKGSIPPRLAQHFRDAGKTTLWVPSCKGGTQASNWTRSLDTATLYGAAKARADAVGGVDKILIFLGANDAIGGVSQATFVSRINQLIADLRTDHPAAQIYLVKIHDFAGYGTNVQTIRAGVQEIWDNNPNVRPGGDMNGITTAVHYATDAEMIEVANRIYAALNADATAETGAGTGAGSGTGADATVSATAETGAGTGAGTGTGADASATMSADGNAESGTGTGTGSGASAEATGSATAETGAGSGLGAGTGSDAIATEPGAAIAETGTGTGTGSGSGPDAAGTATAETGTGTGTGSGSTADQTPVPFDATAFLTRLATLTAVAHRAIGQPWTVGESARLNIVAADHEGAPYDPDTLRLLVKPPAAAVATYDKPDFTREQSGIYHIAIPLDLAGNWYYSVQIVGQAVIEGAIAVQPSRFVQS